MVATSQRFVNRGPVRIFTAGLGDSGAARFSGWTGAAGNIGL